MGGKTHEAQWLPSEEETLERLWATGISASKIGAEMNRNRNMIIGKARRMKLPPRAVGAPGRPRGARDQQKRVVAPRGAFQEQEETAPAGGVHLMDLEQHHCRYIVGHGSDGLAKYCGGQKTMWKHPRGRTAIPVSYCKKHADICHYSG